MTLQSRSTCVLLTPQDGRRDRARRPRICVRSCDELVGLSLGAVGDARQELLEQRPVGWR